jgi:GTP pyrophosphokinase
MRGDPPLIRPRETASEPFVLEGRLQRAVEGYLPDDGRQYVEDVLSLVHSLQPVPGRREGGTHRIEHQADHQVDHPETSVAPHPARGRGRWDVEYVIAVALALAETVHADAASLGAVLIYQAIELGMITSAEVRGHLRGAYAEETAGLVESIERFDALQRPAAARRRAADRHDRTDRNSEREEPARERRRERQRRDEAEAVRKMFVGMAEDPRVVIFKIADQLCTMRAVRDAVDILRTRAGAASSHSPAPTTLDAPGEEAPAESARLVANGRPVDERPVDGHAHMAPDDAEPLWTLEECLAAAEETRTLYAPLAGRLGMGRMESELEDLAFAVLEPDEYRWLSEAVAREQSLRGSYVDRVCDILREEMAKLGIRADVSGRIKHLYSIYKKVQRTGTRDMSQLYDIVAFRVLVDTVPECYLALGHVHQLWRPKDGRIKDFIANPKPNGYQSLHTTVFCLDDRLAEIQIRTRAMHQVAEFGVAMHWHYKEAGDSAASSGRQLQTWVRQVTEWQQELGLSREGPADRMVEAVKGDVLNEQIYVFTPAGDPRELPAGSTPLDFAYRIHSAVGNHVSGARVTSDEGGRLTTRMVPLDYELRNGDTVQILTTKTAHPTRDWLQFIHTKAARTHIQRYIKEHERHIDQQIGRERLDREMKTQGFRGGYEDVREDDLLWVAGQLGQPDVESLLVAIGADKLRPNQVILKLRERLPLTAEPREAATPVTEPARAPETEPAEGVDVAGVAGLYTRLANCCSPVPGDKVLGFITRGRGVVVHRADCPVLAAMLAREPERAVPVDITNLDGSQLYRVPIIVQAVDRPGLLADVTGVISKLKINMVKVGTITNPTRHTATITAVLELQRADQLDLVLRHVQGVKSVLSVERKHSGKAAAEPEPKRPAKKGGR